MINRYLGTFAPGFEGVMADLLVRYVPSAVDISVTSGMITFASSCPIGDPACVPFFNNAFLVLREWNTSASTFHDLVKSSAGKSTLPSVARELARMAGSSFRVRFSKENQFTSVDVSVSAYAEKFIAGATGLRVDRMESGMEFWFIIRRENISFFAARLTKKQSTEKYLEKGELRPEIAQLVIALAGITAEDRILLDPFAGYGSIPEQMCSFCENAVIYASELDRTLVTFLSRRFSGNSRVRVREGDALSLDWIADRSVDAIVTDPPWGCWDSATYAGERSVDNLYAGMLAQFDRVLSDRGRAVVVTAAKREFEAAVANSPPFAQSASAPGFRTDILINGKKSAAFRISRPRPE